MARRNDSNGGARASSAEKLGPALPPGARVTRFRVGDDELAVLSFPVAEPELPSNVTSAEREVVAHLLDGLSNAEIAELRGTSVRTVANQVASIFRKLGVQSRAELIGRLSD